MTPNKLLHKHLCKVLQTHKLTRNIKKKLDDVFHHIRRLLKACLKDQARIYKAGSHIKNTMIKDKWDLDIVIYYPVTETRSPKELKAEVKALLENAGYVVNGGYVALEIEHNDIKIDVVVGRAKDKNFEYANLYNSKTRKKQRSSLQRARRAIKYCPHLIRIMKIWQHQHGVKLHKLFLEKCVTGLFQGRPPTNFGVCFKHILEDLKSSVESRKVSDPTNSNNPINADDSVREIVKELVTKHYKWLDNPDKFDGVIQISN